MSRSSLWFLSLSGYIAPLWLLVGVVVASQFYDGYNHADQMLSELGATGSPTANLSPFLNNYPLSLLFATFGFCVATSFPESKSAQASGYLIIGHGVGTLVAGFYPCDFECPKDSASMKQVIHGIAGGFMFLSLTLANFLWVLIPATISGRRWFKWFSLASALLSLYFLVPMFDAMESDSEAGLYQRLNYGVALIWLLVLAHITERRLLPLPNRTERP